LQRPPKGQHDVSTDTIDVFGRSHQPPAVKGFGSDGMRGLGRETRLTQIREPTYDRGPRRGILYLLERMRSPGRPIRFPRSYDCLSYTPRHLSAVETTSDSNGRRKFEDDRIGEARRACIATDPRAEADLRFLPVPHPDLKTEFFDHRSISVSPIPPFH